MQGFKFQVRGYSSGCWGTWEGTWEEGVSGGKPIAVGVSILLFEDV